MAKLSVGEENGAERADGDVAPEVAVEGVFGDIVDDASECDGLDERGQRDGVDVGADPTALLAFADDGGLVVGDLLFRANVVGPGLVPTPGTGTVYDDERVREVRAGAVPLRRLGTDADIAGVVSFLASPDAAYVNGQVLHVDGGLSQALMTLLPRPADVPGPHED